MKVEVFLSEEKTKAIVDVKVPLLDYYDAKAKQIKIAGKEVVEILKKRGLKPIKVECSAVVRNTSEHARKGRFIVQLEGYEPPKVEEPKKTEKKTTKRKTKKVVSRKFDATSGKIKKEYE